MVQTHARTLIHSLIYECCSLSNRPLVRLSMANDCILQHNFWLKIPPKIYSHASMFHYFGIYFFFGGGFVSCQLVSVCIEIKFVWFSRCFFFILTVISTLNELCVLIEMTVYLCEYLSKWVYAAQNIFVYTFQRTHHLTNNHGNSTHSHANVCITTRFSVLI